MGCEKESNSLKLKPTRMVYSSIEEYSKTSNLLSEKQIIDTTSFVFVNNPYGIDEHCHFALFINNENFYSGMYKKSILIDISKFEERRINLSIEVLAPLKGSGYCLHRFTNKSTIYWDRNYKFIYACFFPFNQDIDKIHFFPTKEDVIH